MSRTGDTASRRLPVRALVLALLAAGGAVAVAAAPARVPVDDCPVPPLAPADPARSRQIVFDGGNEAADGAVYDGAAMSPPVREDGRTYRLLRARRPLRVDLPAFDTGADGLPRGPMLLQIRYRDDAARPGEAVVRSRLDRFHADDPAAEGIRDYDNLGALGGNGDHAWHDFRFLFAATPFPLVRAVDGAFRVTVAGAAVDLPIASVSLRSVTPAEAEAFRLARRQCLGFRRVDLPPDGPPAPIAYPGPDLVAFPRDPMRPVYPHTRPFGNEVGSRLDLDAAPGQVEAATFGLYSRRGAAGVRVEAADLRCGGGRVLPASAVEVKRVAYADKRLAPWVLPGVGQAWARVPDALVDAGTFAVPADRSERAWLEIHVPADLAGATCAGPVRVLQDGRVRRTLSLRVRVLPVPLEPPAQLDPMYGDPFVLTTTNRLDEVFRLYRETGVEPFLAERDGDIRTTRGADGRFAFDLSGVGHKLDVLERAGLLKRPVMYMIWKVRADVEQALFGHAAGPDAWKDLSDPRFVEAFGQVIRDLNDLAARHGTRFLYNCADEPRDKPVARMLCDRVDAIVHANGGRTSVTYHLEADRPLRLPDAGLPPLTGSVDLPVWAPHQQDAGYALHRPAFGYYTTTTSYLWNPVYNRFLHGWLAVATGAAAVSAFAMGAMIADPYDDFDRAADGVPFPDVLLADPTWDGRLVPRLALVGVREGIQDARWVATLRAAIAARPADPVAREAAAWLDGVVARVDRDFWADYAKRSTDLGFAGEVVRNVSPAGRPDDWEAFTALRGRIAGYLRRLGAGAGTGTEGLRRSP